MVQLFVHKQYHQVMQAKDGDYLYICYLWILLNSIIVMVQNIMRVPIRDLMTSTDTTVELLDKNTGSVVETRTVTASSGVQKFTTTTAASNSQLTFQVDYNPGIGDCSKW